VFEPRFRGIWVADSRNTLVADCTIMDRTKAATMLAAVEVAGKSAGTVVRGNTVGRGTRGAVLAPGATVEGNHEAAR
jgi:hypothetical protein